MVLVDLDSDGGRRLRTRLNQSYHRRRCVPCNPQRRDAGVCALGRNGREQAAGSLGVEQDRIKPVGCCCVQIADGPAQSDILWLQRGEDARCHGLWKALEQGYAQQPERGLHVTGLDHLHEMAEQTEARDIGGCGGGMRP